MSLSAKRVEVHYAAVQGTYWASNCTLRGLMTVFLSYHGLSDAQIGYTSSLVYFCTISLSLLLSAWADRHPQSPLKRMVAALYLLALAAAAVMYALPLPVLLMMVVYTLDSCFHNCADSILNALMMQFVDNGIPARYGWPRGVGSITYAIMAWVLGVLMERYTPNIILPVFLALCSISLLALAVLPAPDRASSRRMRSKCPMAICCGATPRWCCCCVPASFRASDSAQEEPISSAWWRGWAAHRHSWDLPCLFRPVWSCP